MAEKVNRELTAYALEGEDAAHAIARTALRPTVQAALSLQELGVGHDLVALVDALGALVKDANAGNVERSEAMMIAQAQTLDAIFHATLRRSAANFGHYPESAERYMKLALKAQSQCRVTLEAAATLKSPKVGHYVAQQNIAHGPQQVNNVSENELLGHQHGERLDFGTTQEAIGDDPELETVGAVNRAED